MSVLRIYFPAQWHDSASACPWALCEESGAVLQSGTGSLASMPKAGECIGILAPERTLFLSVKAPPGSRRQWKAALPFLAEGQTLPDPEENHVVLAAEPSGGQLPLAIADKGWLRRIADACRTAGLPLRKIVPEALLPALPKSGWVVVRDGTGGFVRTGTSSAMALDAADGANPPVALHLLLNHAAAAQPGKINVRFMPGASSGADAALPRWENVAVPLEQGEPWVWRRASIPADVPNLLLAILRPAF